MTVESGRTPLAPRAALRPGGSFAYRNPAEIHYGSGSIRAIPVALSELGVTRALIVTTRSLLESRVLDAVRTQSPVLLSADVTTASGHVGVPDVVRAAAAIRASGAQAVIAVGGGSAIDTAKFAAVLATSQSARADLSAVEAVQLLQDTSIRAEAAVIAVPTTLSAAELCGDAGFTHPETGQKTGVVNRALMPAMVVYDPEAAAETPRVLWASTGFRALDHAVETWLAPHADPISLATAASAAGDLLSVLPRFRDGVGTADDRLEAQIGAWKSFVNPAVAASGLSHVIGRVIGAKNGVPHGITSCVVLPKVIRALAQHDECTRARLMDLEELLSLDPSALSLAEAIESAVADCGLPSRFAREQVDHVAAQEAVEIVARATGRPADFIAPIVASCVD